MNPKICIEVDAKNRAIASLTGMVTVGAKVDVEITGLPSVIPDWGTNDDFRNDSKSLRLRIVDGAGHDLVRFPLEKKTSATAVDGDQWTVVASAGTTPETYKTNNASATTPEVDFNTYGLRREMRGVPFDECREFGVILDSMIDKAQYAVGRIKIRQWSVASTEDPTVLPDWRETLTKLECDLASVETAKTAAESARDAAQASQLSASGYASSALGSKNDAATYASNASSSASAALGYANTASGHASSASNSAAQASASASKYPYIDEDGHWKVWENGAWVDKGSSKGDAGSEGPQGPQGACGDGWAQWPVSEGGDGKWHRVTISHGALAFDENGVDQPTSGQFAVKNSNETITGNWTFNGATLKGSALAGVGMPYAPASKYVELRLPDKSGDAVTALYDGWLCFMHASGYIPANDYAGVFLLYDSKNIGSQSVQLFPSQSVRCILPVRKGQKVRVHWRNVHPEYTGVEFYLVLTCAEREVTPT